ncbi:MAG: 2-amino-4-hydroxy-6-hydroxymethyldihydropteridine diphosphokinase [Cytophagales bacterium]
MNHFVLSLGSNISNRVGYLSEALKEMTAIGKVKNVSSVYETEPWGVSGQQPYLNLCLLFETEINAKDLLIKCQEIENKLGRVRNERWGSRTIDIDIILQKNETTQHHNLQVPHPRMHERRFVLIPLAEICADWEHQVLKSSVSSLLNLCNDNTEVGFFGKILV